MEYVQRQIQPVDPIHNVRGAVPRWTRRLLPLLGLVVLPYALLLMLSIALTPAESYAVTGCGGEGQRACCTFFAEGNACVSGLVEVAGCSGDCTCGGTNIVSDIRSSG